MIPVAAYCRVSTDSSDQAGSFENQQRYFREHIRRQPEWTLHRIYADEGVTGTSTKNRSAFHQMLRDAQSGCFHLLLTKEVSRFSRNILDTIAYTRKLRQYGVGVLFLTDGINTLDPDAELRLSIMASLAQEESRKTSLRVKWGQLRRMEQGVVFGHAPLGYTLNGGMLQIEPEGAALVRLIFHKYGVEKKGADTIARELRSAGHGGWSSGGIRKILQNEKYVGDLVQKKTITPDYLTHARRKNHGEEPLVTLHEHHEAIISRALWDDVQMERKRRSPAPVRRRTSRHPLSGKIRCGECGASFAARTKTRPDGSSYLRWRCGNASAGKGCTVGCLLRDDLAFDMVRQVFTSLAPDTQAAAAELTERICAALSGAVSDASPALARELRRLSSRQDAALDAFLSGELSRDEFHRVRTRYDEQRRDLQSRLSRQTDKSEIPPDLPETIGTITNCGNGCGAFLRHLLDSITVYRDRRVEIRLHLLPGVWQFELHP